MGTQKMKLIKKIFSYIAPIKRKVIVACLLMLVSSLSGFFQPQAIREITDVGIAQSNVSNLFFYTFALGLLIITSQIVELIVSKLFADIYNDFFSHYLEIHLERFLRKKAISI